jgi:hypothetical protein
MTTTILRLLTRATLFGVTLTLVVWSASRAGGTRTGQQEKNEAQTRKTMRDVAHERDIEMTYEPESDSEFGDLESMVRIASTIVLGRIINIESSFDKSNQHIESFYTIEVSRVLKSDSPVKSPLRLFRPGGTVPVNGHTATTKVKGNEFLANGRDYIFFMGWRPRHQVYTLEGGLGAVFLVKENSVIKSLSTSEGSRLRLKYDGADLQSFVDEVLKPH